MTQVEKIGAVEYNLVHRWMDKNYGRASKHPCFISDKHFCRKSWACIDGIYERDPVHFKVLCSKCHSRYDFSGISLQELREKYGEIEFRTKRKSGRKMSKPFYCLDREKQLAYLKMLEEKGL
jgi:hypothetical protein